MEGRMVKDQIGVIAGGGPLASGAVCSPEIYEIACPKVALWPDVGREIATKGFALVCGGLGGVMPKVALWPEAACQGAKPKVARGMPTPTAISSYRRASVTRATS
jgi:predicted Rossmann-fold nucleotide-binding protein